MRKFALSLVFFWALILGGVMTAGLTQAQEAKKGGNDEIGAHLLSDKMIGDKDAPVTIIEFASLTCPHCARFHAGPYKELKKQYIDTGKAKMIFRDFPLDGYALRAAAVAHCLPDSRYFGFIDMVLKKQGQWLRPQTPEGRLDELAKLAQLAGLKKERAMACMENRELLGAIVAKQRENQQKHGIDETPSFVIDGERQRIFEFAEFKKLLDAKLN